MGAEWLSGDLIEAFLLVQAKHKGWGVNKMPPARGQNVWICSNAGFTADWIDPMNRVKIDPTFCAGVTGKFDRSDKGPFKALIPEQIEELVSRAMQVELALLPLHLDKSHWIYVQVNFKTHEILLHNSYGTPVEVESTDQTLHILNRVSQWAKLVQTARKTLCTEFKFKTVTTNTQPDGHQCGVHISWNIFAVGCGLAGRVNGKISERLRICIGLLLWLSSDKTIEIPSLEFDKTPTILRDHIDTVKKDTNVYLCTPVSNVEPVVTHIFHEIQDLLTTQPTVTVGSVVIKDGVVSQKVPKTGGLLSVTPFATVSVKLEKSETSNDDLGVMSKEGARVVCLHQPLMDRFTTGTPRSGPSTAPWTHFTKGKSSKPKFPTKSVIKKISVNIHTDKRVQKFESLPAELIDVAFITFAKMV